MKVRSLMSLCAIFSAPGPVVEDQLVNERFQIGGEATILEGLLEAQLDRQSPFPTELPQKSVAGGFSGVRNEAENRIRQIVIDRFENPPGQRPTQFLALPINVGVVAPGEINAFKGTGGTRAADRRRVQSAYARRV